MKKKFYHFGDSYARVSAVIPDSKHFCNIIADQLDMEYIPYGVNGIPNEIILKSVLENMYRFKKDDIVFINFSFFERGCFYNREVKKITPSTHFYNDIRKLWNTKHEKYEEYARPIVEYYVNNTEDYSRRIFDLFNLTLKHIDKLGVNIFYIFAGSSEYENELIDVGNCFKFPNGFSNWLIKNQFHKNQDNHYTLGIQPMFSDVIMRKTNNMNKCEQKNIHIDMDDLNFDLVSFTKKLL